MKDKEKIGLLSKALQAVENVSDHLDRAYIAHCNATGIKPNIEQHTAGYRKNRLR